MLYMKLTHHEAVGMFYDIRQIPRGNNEYSQIKMLRMCFDARGQTASDFEQNSFILECSCTSSEFVIRKKLFRFELKFSGLIKNIKLLPTKSVSVRGNPLFMSFQRGFPKISFLLCPIYMYDSDSPFLWTHCPRFWISVTWESKASQQSLECKYTVVSHGFNSELPLCYYFTMLIIETFQYRFQISKSICCQSNPWLWTFNKISW